MVNLHWFRVPSSEIAERSPAGTCRSGTRNLELLTSKFREFRYEHHTASIESREHPIKGPGYRLDLDARRTWLCPVCGQRSKTPGDVVAADCGTCPDRPAMKFAEDFPARRSPRHALATIQPPPSDDALPATPPFVSVPENFRSAETSPPKNGIAD